MLFLLDERTLKIIFYTYMINRLQIFSSTIVLSNTPPPPLRMDASTKQLTLVGNDNIF